MFQNGICGTGQLCILISVVNFTDGTKVQQLGRAIVLDHDIVRTDIPVDNLIFMNFIQRIHHRAENLQGFRYA